jgi:hypothetical protein
VDQLVYIARRAESVSLWPAPSSTAVAEQHEAGLVHLAHNPSFSTYFFNQNSIFLLKKSVNSVFQSNYNSSRTAPLFGKHVFPRQIVLFAAG